MANIVGYHKPKHHNFIGSYTLMVASLGFGTVTLVNIAGANVKLWQLFLLTTLAVSILKSRVVFANKAAIVIVIAIAFSCLLSGMNAVDTHLYIKQILLLFGMLTLFLVVAQKHHANDLTQVLRWVIYPGLFVAGWGLLETFLYPEDLSFYSSFLGVLPRASSFFAEANEFSQYLNLPFAFSLAMLAYYKPLSRLERFVLIIGIFMIIVAQMMTFSRGGILSFGAQIIAWLLLAGWQSRNISSFFPSIIKIVFTLILTILVLGILAPSLFEISRVVAFRFQSLISGNDATTAVRLLTIAKGLDAASASWNTLFLGIGFGNLPVVLGEGVANAGNFLVDIFSELGLVGLLVIILSVGACLILPLKHHKLLIEKQNEKLLTVFYAAYLSFFGLVVGGMTYSTFMLNLFWFCGGMLMSLNHFGNKLRAR